MTDDVSIGTSLQTIHLSHSTSSLPSAFSMAFAYFSLYFSLFRFSLLSYCFMPYNHSNNVSIFLSQLLDIDMTVYPLDDQREDEQREDRGTYESTDDHRGERTLALTADAMTECGGQQAEGSHHSRH